MKRNRMPKLERALDAIIQLAEFRIKEQIADKDDSIRAAAAEIVRLAQDALDI